MAQIPRDELIPWRWYLGRGRNGNVGLWNGEDFLVITATRDPAIKREPYFSANGGCFQPFREIDEGEVTQRKIEDGIVTVYGEALVDAEAALDELLDLHARLSGLEVLVAARPSRGRSSLPALAAAGLVVLERDFADAQHRLSAVTTLLEASPSFALYRGAQGQTLRVDAVDDFPLGLPGPAWIETRIAGHILRLQPRLHRLALLCQRLAADGNDNEALGTQALDLIDTTDDHERERLACALSADAAIVLDEFLDTARRRRFSWSEFVQHRRKRSQA